MVIGFLLPTSLELPELRIIGLLDLNLLFFKLFLLLGQCRFQLCLQSS